MPDKPVINAGRSGISMGITQETLQTNCALFVDKKFVLLGVAANEESSVANVASLSLSSCQLKKPVYDQQSCIYKRSSEMAGNIACLRYLLTASFILLGISGGVVCGTGSYFVHQLHGSLTNTEWYGPPILLLTTGVVNIILGPYFWFTFDTKYNRPQLFMFFVLVVLVATIEAGAGMWSIIDHGKVDSSISKILEQNLASIGRNDGRIMWNVTEIKMKCCGFEDPSSLKDENYSGNNNNEISWSCCNGRNYNDDQQNDNVDTCTVFYINECHDLALHRYRSILFYTFVVALCATIVQILVSVVLRAYTKRFQNKKRRQSIATSVNQRHSRIACPAVQLGGQQHICEACSSVQYH